MKVYTKKETGVAGPVLSIFISLLFWGIPLGYYVYLGNLFINNRDLFFETFWNGIIIIFFSLFFFVIGIILLCIIIKRPVKKVATLTKKTKCKYKGEEIISMTFNVRNEKENYNYKCYTKTDNNLIKGNNYIIAIKESYYKIVKVLPYNSDIKINHKIPYRDYKKGFKIAVFGVLFVIDAPLVIIYIKTLLDILNNTYNKKLTFPLIAFTVFGILTLIVCKKYLNTIDGKKEENNIDISKYSTLKENETYITNAPRKMIIREMILILICWIFVELLFLILCNINDFKNTLIIITICTIPLLILEMSKLFILCKYYNFDDNLLKKYNINTNNEIDLKNIRSFKIVKMHQISGIYYIIDNENNLLYKVVNKGWSNIYNIINKNNKKVGEIHRKLLKLNPTYIIKIINKNPIIVESLYQINYSYKVYNTCYDVIGNYSDRYKDITNIIRDNSRNIANIQFLGSKNLLYRFSSAEVMISDSTNNNETIIFIAMSITLGNQERLKTEHNRK